MFLENEVSQSFFFPLFLVFDASLRYLDQLGMAAKYRTKVYCRQTLIGGNYGLLNTGTFVPNPDFYRQEYRNWNFFLSWKVMEGFCQFFYFHFQLHQILKSFSFMNSALLWHRLMGTGVLDVNSDASPFLRSYAHCSKERVRLQYFFYLPSYYES